MKRSFIEKNALNDSFPNAQQLRAEKVPGDGKLPIAQWPRLAETWLATIGMISN